MKLKIFGPNLRDQSKGQFVVHAADCADCEKLKGEQNFEIDAASELEVSADLNSDFISDGSMTAAEGLSEIHFAPCVRFEGGAK